MFRELGSALWRGPMARRGCTGGWLPGRLSCVFDFDNNVRTVFESGGKAQTRALGVQNFIILYG